MGGSSAEKNAVFEFLHFDETPSSASEVSRGGRNYGGQNPLVSPAALTSRLQLESKMEPIRPRPHRRR
jgi:hypothetical protein